MLRLALRLHRGGAVAATAIVFFYSLVQSAAFASVAGSTAESRAVFQTQMNAIATQISYLLPLPDQVGTLGGYVQWRVYGFSAIMLAGWAVFAAAGAARGDEERGLVEQWLARGLSKARYIWTRFAAFAIVAVTAAASTGLAAWIVAVASNEPVPVWPLVQISAALALVTVCCWAVVAALAQLAATRGSATGLGGAAIAFLFFTNSLARTDHALDGIARLSPFHAYDLTKTLVPGGHFELAGNLAVASATVILLAGAAFAFSRRDLGAPLFGSRRAGEAPAYEPSRNPLLRVSVIEQLWEHRYGLLAWMLVFAGFASMLASLAKSVTDFIRASPSLSGYFRLFGSTNLYQAVISFEWFTIAQGMLAVYVITRVARWSAEDAEGRLEMALSQPVPRWRVVVERFVGLVIGIVVLAVVGTLATVAVTQKQGFTLDPNAVERATLLLLPFALTFGAIGGVLSAYYPRIAVPVLSFLALGGYLLQQFAPIFNWPSWVTHFSLFDLYGTPMLQGVWWGGLWAMVAIIVVGLAASLLAMQRRQVGN